MWRVQVQPVSWPLNSDADLALWRSLENRFLSQDPNYPIHAKGQLSPTERLEIILCHQSFLIRASDLALFIEQCPAPALKDNYQLIVDTIFSHRNREQSWDLRCMRRADQPREAAAVFRLLAPDGPLINLALRLMEDNHFLIEFPVDGLPFHVRQKLNRMEIPFFLQNKISAVYDTLQQRNVVQHLLLNPFEYYFFCFGAINLLGLTTGRSPDYLHGWAALQDTVYTNILEDYFGYYFPCDGNGVPCHNFTYMVHQQTNDQVFLANSLLRQQYSKHKVGVGIGFAPEVSSHLPDENGPKLFKSTILQDHTSSVTARDNIYHATHPSTYKEVWRSETILQIFMELWMCGFDEGPNQAASMAYISPLTYGGLPSVEVVKSIRMMVRHLHYFINCVNSHAMHPMEDIKRNFFPTFQKRLYVFLRYLFQHWPLDNSFRIVYETWLSYIQPWRYISFERARGNILPREAAEAPVDARWFNFILENILCYSKLLAEILIRAERVDLSASKNALMLYRVAKVITSHDSLKIMIVDIESQIKSYESQATASSISGGILPAQHQRLSSSAVFSTPSIGKPAASSNHNTGYFGGNKLSPMVSPSSTTFFQDFGASLIKIGHMKHLMKELEGSNYVYEPLFSDNNRKRVARVFVLVDAARESLCGSVNLMKENKTKRQSLWQWFIGAPPPSQIAAQAAAEKNKSANQLEFGKNQLSSFFEVPMVGFDRSGGIGGLQSCGSFDRDSFSAFQSSRFNDNSHSSDESSRRKSYLPADYLLDDMFVPLGNPDMVLIRSDECHSLVRLLYHLSNALNAWCQPTFESVYFEESWRGRCARALLAEPKEYYKSEKHSGRKSVFPRRSSAYLPPRINLRFLASYFTWCYVFIIMVIGSLFNLSSVTASVSLFVLGFLYLVGRVVFEPADNSHKLFQRYLRHQTDHEEGREGPRDPEYRQPRSATPHQT